MRFNAGKFMANADSVCRKALPESHRQALEGKEVINGQTAYNADGCEWYLFPVLPEWCDGDKQERGMIWLSEKQG